MKCQILFSGKNKKNIINLSSAENAQRVVKVKDTSTLVGLDIRLTMQKNNLIQLRIKYSRLSLSRIPRDSLKYFEISVVRHIRFVELRKK